MNKRNINGISNKPRDSANKKNTVPYARRKAAEWLLAYLKKDTSMKIMNHNFFKCLNWVTSEGLRGILHRIVETVKGKLNDADQDMADAYKHITDAMKCSYERLVRDFDDLVSNYPSIRDIAKKCIMLECRSIARSQSPDSREYARIKNSFAKTFGFSKESAILCEFIYFNHAFSSLSDYFGGNEIDIWQPTSRIDLARILNISPSILRESGRCLESADLLESGYNGTDLAWPALSFWVDMNSRDMSKQFCAPLTGQVLPLNSFHVSKEAVKHTETLLSIKNDSEKTPVHILLYGPPGTGKTTFARSLAKLLGVKAWTVSSREHDDDGVRRASLTACLNIAEKHPGSFVLVDEAERLLDTSWKSKDKAWLNSFLEQPGKRVIWITNQVEHIDPAVRRRFSYSIYFGPLGKEERRQLWDQVIARYRVNSCLSGSMADAFAGKYKVSAAVIEQAISQAKIICGGIGNKKGKEVQEKFGGVVEQVLQAHVTLCAGGNAPRPKVNTKPDEKYTISGVCLDATIDELMNKFRRADSVYAEKGALPRGGGTMLFYGPPGTGKTALARHIADEMKRKCFVKRASDILSPWVGEAEQNVAEAFRYAEEEGAVLVIDEADTFLYSREVARRSWENSIVNEFLTALEECRGFCICTTNRMENFDAAAMRRFSFKVGFTYAGAEQVAALYSAILAPLAGGELPRLLEAELCRMTRLTPGDFHAVRSQYWLSERGEVSHVELIGSLKREQEMKLDKEKPRIGFAV